MIILRFNCLLALYIFLVLATGCVKLPSAITIDASNDKSSNDEILKSDFKHEWAFNRDPNNRNSPPRLGLAISGGGTRSASFSIGVLKALQENGVLDKVDVISAVSGGAYATYWYFMQNCYLNRSTTKEFCPTKVGANLENSKKDFVAHPSIIFDASSDKNNTNLTNPDKYRFQLVLEDSSHILSYEKKPGFKRTLLNTGQTVGDVSLQIISVPLHWIVNGLMFDWDWNVNPYRHFYENGLERTYGYVPLDYTLENFANDDSYFGGLVPRVNAIDVSFNNMTSYLVHKRDVENKPMPYFVINATATVNRNLDLFDDQVKTLKTAVFEFTPWGCGSGLTGYHPFKDCPSEISFGRAVSISGAAVDGKNESIDPSGKSEGPIKTLDGLQNIFNLNIGYNIANPNANPWVRALHKAAPFPLYFIADIFETENPSDIHLSDGGHIENLGLYSLVRRETRNIIVIDAEQDNKTVFEALRRLQYNLKNEMHLDLVIHQPDGPVNNYDTPFKDAISFVEISGLKGEEPIHILYIKLSLDQEMLQAPGQCREDKYMFSITNYQNKDKKFPHDPTSDINYNPDEYRAYRDLGYSIGMQIKNHPVFIKFKDITKQTGLLWENNNDL